MTTILLFACLLTGDVTTSFDEAVAYVKTNRDINGLLEGKEVNWEGYVHPSDKPRIGFLMLKHKLVSGQDNDLVMAHVTYSRNEYFQLGQQIRVIGRCVFKDDHFEIKASKILYPGEKP